MQSPLVSIACTTYNHQNFIRDAIEGFLMQNVSFPIEIIIHDDASTDKTADIVREYAQQFPGLCIPIFQKKNQYSKGIKILNTFIWPRIRGKYIAICEGDDYWTDPMKLQKQIDFLEANSDFAICHHNMQVIYEESEKKTHFSNSPDQKEVTTITDLANGNYIYTASCVYRNGMFGKTPEWVNKCPIGDYPLHMLIAQTGRIKYIPDVMGVYRVHKGGVWEHRDINYRIGKRFEMLNLMIDKFTPEINEILRVALKKDAEYLMTLFKDQPERCRSYAQKLLEIDHAYFADLKFEITILIEKNKAADESLKLKNDELFQKDLDMIEKIRVADESLRLKNDELYQKDLDLIEKKKAADNLLKLKNDELYQKDLDLIEKDRVAEESLRLKNDELNQMDIELKKMMVEINQITGSRSWKITNPLRVIMKRLKKFYEQP